MLPIIFIQIHPLFAFENKNLLLAFRDNAETRDKSIL